jgi:glutamate racemase
MMKTNQPIGIFDSGIGGLTVAHAITEKLPHENIIYFGDTAHLPYGDKSAETIQRYCLSIIDFLLAQHCKVILVACNSAAASAYEAMQNYLQNRVPLIGVIDPVVNECIKKFPKKVVGLIGTKRTVESRVFETKIQTSAKNIQLKALATPLLVPIIEENFHSHEKLVDEALKLYLSQASLQNIDALVLACTHYPVLKSRIAAFYDHQVPLLDAGEITANALAELLKENHLLNPQTAQGQRHFFVSDLTPAFAKMANEFFGENIVLEITKPQP